MTMNTEETAAYVARMAPDTEEWLAGLYRKIDKAERKGNDAKAERLREEMESYGQSVRRVVTISLAGGGPSHWLEVTLDEDGDPVSAVSVASWAGPEVRTPIYPSRDSALWCYVEDQTSFYGPMREDG